MSSSLYDITTFIQQQRSWEAVHFCFMVGGFVVCLRQQQNSLLCAGRKTRICFKMLFLLPKITVGSAALFWGFSGRGVELTIHLQVLKMLRMQGAVPPLPIRLQGVVLSKALETSYPLSF